MRSQALCHPIVSECLWAFHVGRLQLSQLAHSSLPGRWSATRASPPRPRVSDYLCLILLVLSLNAFDLKVNFPTKPAHNPPLFVSDKFFSMHLFVTATPIKHLHILKKFLLVVATCLANISFPPSAPHLHCPSCCVRWDLGSRVPSVSPTLSSHRGPALEALISALSRTQPCTNRPGTVRPWAVPLACLCSRGQPATCCSRWLSWPLTLRCALSLRAQYVLCCLGPVRFLWDSAGSPHAEVLWCTAALGAQPGTPSLFFVSLGKLCYHFGFIFFIQDAILIPVYCATVHTKKK